MAGIDQSIICISEITDVNSNTDLNQQIIGGNGQGRARESYGLDWGEDLEE